MSGPFPTPRHRAGPSTAAPGLSQPHPVAHHDPAPQFGHEYERLRRVSERRGHGVDDTHPPTHLRLRCLAQSEPQAAQVDFDDERAAAIAAELAPARTAMARQVVRTVRSTG